MEPLKPLKDLKERRNPKTPIPALHRSQETSSAPLRWASAEAGEQVFFGMFVGLGFRLLFGFGLVVVGASTVCGWAF